MIFKYYTAAQVQGVRVIAEWEADLRERLEKNRFDGAMLEAEGRYLAERKAKIEADIGEKLL